MSRYGRNIPSLGAEELRLIEECLEEDASRRRSFVPEGPLLIVIDDAQCGSLDPNKERKFRREVDHDNKWVEVQAQTKKGSLLLATHLYRYDEVPENGRKRKYSSLLEGGQKINFTTYFARNAEGDKAPFINISYHETKIFRALLLFWHRLKNELRKLMRPITDCSIPVLAFVRGFAARQMAYPLALAGLAISLTVPMLYILQSLHKDNPSIVSVSQVFNVGSASNVLYDFVKQSPPEIEHGPVKINAPEVRPNAPDGKPRQSRINGVRGGVHISRKIITTMNSPSTQPSVLFSRTASPVIPQGYKQTLSNHMQLSVLARRTPSPNLTRDEQAFMIQKLEETGASLDYATQVIVYEVRVSFINFGTCHFK